MVPRSQCQGTDGTPNTTSYFSFLISLQMSGLSQPLSTHTSPYFFCLNEFHIITHHKCVASSNEILSQRFRDQRAILLLQAPGKTPSSLFQFSGLLISMAGGTQFLLILPLLVLASSTFQVHLVQGNLTSRSIIMSEGTPRQNHVFSVALTSHRSKMATVLHASHSYMDFGHIRT